MGDFHTKKVKIEVIGFLRLNRKGSAVYDKINFG